MDSNDSLQAYFEQQNDKEAASIVAEVVALLPSNASWNEDLESDSVLDNILLTKESEISALKEVVLKWRERAFQAESYYAEQLEMVKLQYDYEFRMMESRYQRKLDEKEDDILNLNDQLDYLISQQQNGHRHSSGGDTDSYVSTMDYDSISSSIYDRDAEQGLDTSRSTVESNSENIFDNIQDTLRAIEHELSVHTSITTSDHESIISTATRRHHRRSPTNTSSNTYYSSATLIESDASITKKKIKKSSFSINRIFKKAFPKLYKKQTSKYTSKALPQYHCHDEFPRSITEETLGASSSIHIALPSRPVLV